MQMLVNLLNNAIKFTSTGGKIGLDVHGDRTHEALFFTVWDTGIGIAAAVIPRLFQPFVQLAAALHVNIKARGWGWPWSIAWLSCMAAVSRWKV